MLCQHCLECRAGPETIFFITDSVVKILHYKCVVHPLICDKFKTSEFFGF